MAACVAPRTGGVPVTPSTVSRAVAVVETPSPAAVALAHRTPDPDPVSALPRARLAISRVALVVSVVGAFALLLLFYEFVLSGIPAARTQAELTATFKQAVPTTTLDLPSTTPEEGTPVALLRIPRIGLTQVVVEGSSPSDLKIGPGHLSASPLPGEYGNSVIEGRRTTYGAPFGAIDSLHRGDTVSVATGQGAFTYTVSSIKRVSPGQPDVVSPTKDSRLTLVTSNPPFIATGRLAVIAKLKGEPVAVPTRPATVAESPDLGLAPDPIGLTVGLLWLILLVAFAYAAWRWRHRFPRSVLYLLAAPVVATLALLAYANLDGLLPGTM